MISGLRPSELLHRFLIDSRYDQVMDSMTLLTSSWISLHPSLYPWQAYSVPAPKRVLASPPGTHISPQDLGPDPSTPWRPPAPPRTMPVPQS